jgi:hypothetical protein
MPQNWRTEQILEWLIRRVSSASPQIISVEETLAALDALKGQAPAPVAEPASVPKCGHSPSTSCGNCDPVAHCQSCGKFMKHGHQCAPSVDAPEAPEAPSDPRIPNPHKY